MSEVHPLEPISLREAWPDEARDFTPWLAGNLQLLAAELNLDLELERVEATLPGAGRVDILARQAVTGDRVVIENQLEESDDSHCLRLLGYAANAEANTLVWVARDFTNYHRGILNWLNESDSIDVYAVTVQAYHVGGVLGASFRIEVEPRRAQRGTTAAARTTMSTHYADFYRPLVAQLRQAGLSAVGRGGWRGRWRSFDSGYSPRAVYATELAEGKAFVFLSMYGSRHQEINQALVKHREEIDRKLDGGAIWNQGEDNSSVALQIERTVTDEETNPDNDENIRQWMAENILRLRATVQPFLDQVMSELQPSDGAAEAAE